MLGRKERRQGELFFVAGSMEGLIPEDYILKKVDRVLDVGWLREEVRELYCEDNGRPSIDPESALRLMLAGFLLGIVHDRELMREARLHMGIRWFGGYGLDEALPDHSSLTRIRQRWGEEKFLKIFGRTVKECVEAGLVKGDLTHLDATLVRADVSWESLVERHVKKVRSENGDEGGDDGGDDGPKGGRKKVSRTDTEATMATSRKDVRLEPSYKQHTAVDDEHGVIVDVEVTTGEENEGKQLKSRLERVEKRTGKKMKAVTCDAAYAHSENYRELEERGIEAVIPPQKEPKKGRTIPLSCFKYDGRNKIVKCLRGKVLRPSRENEKGTIYRAHAADCRNCPLRGKCVPKTAKVRVVLILRGYEALLRARRKHRDWDEETRRMYRRHRWRVEGIHGEAKERHGMRRAVRRGLWNVSIQAYLAAAAMNLKRLAAAFLLLLLRLWGRNTGSGATWDAVGVSMGNGGTILETISRAA